MELVVKVAEYKHQNDMDIIDREREEEVKEEFERLFSERDLPEGRGRELGDYLIQTAIDLEEEIVGKEIDRD
ncbi:MAG: chorismate mutase [Candidatus Nanohaloarchaea archaeon]